MSERLNTLEVDLCSCVRTRKILKYIAIHALYFVKSCKASFRKSVINKDSRKNIRKRSWSRCLNIFLKIIYLFSGILPISRRPAAFLQTKMDTARLRFLYAQIPSLLTNRKKLYDQITVNIEARQKDKKMVVWKRTWRYLEVLTAWSSYFACHNMGSLLTKMKHQATYPFAWHETTNKEGVPS